MKKYALIKDGIVVQVQPNKQDGFIEVENTIVCGMVFKNNEFSIFFDLENYQISKINEINQACNKTIIGGFISFALGTEHTYESTKEDQSNLQGSKDRGISLPQKCSADSGVTWEWKIHTQAQLKKVFDDGVDFKLIQLQKAAQLKAQIQIVKTVEGLEQINW